MADICKCRLKECPLSKSCFRFLAEDSLYQAYFIIDKVPENCKEYWPVKDEEELKKYNDYWKE